MRQFDPIRGSLPVPVSPAPSGGGFSGYRGAPRAAFLSQLIAERHHLATQRVKRRAPVEDVLRTYDAGGQVAVKRMPAGYRVAVDA